MRPTAPTVFSQPQPCHAALHCGELISMKDCGLWATMTCKTSKNFFLALFLHLYAWGAVQKVQSLVRWNAAQVISDSGELREESKMWVLWWPTLKACVCVCVFSLHVKTGKMKHQIDCYHPAYHCWAPCSSLFVPSSWAYFHSVWSTAEPCGALLPSPD